LEVASTETFGDEIESTDIDVKSTELENAAGEPSEHTYISIKPSNARELQFDQIEIIAEQDQASQESYVKPTDQDQATDEISMVGNSDDNTTVVSESVEKNGEESVAKEESVILQEENIAVKMPEEELEKIEATNEKRTEEEANFFILTLQT
jgi:hypothetical protein